MRVTFWKLGDDFEQHFCGEAVLRDGKVMVMPENTVMKNVLEIPAVDMESGSYVNAQTHPEKFLRGLPATYNGSRFSAKLEDGDHVLDKFTTPPETFQDDGRDLAEWHCEMLNDHYDTTQLIDVQRYQDAMEELSITPWSLDFDTDLATWKVVNKSSEVSYAGLEIPAEVASLMDDVGSDILAEDILKKPDHYHITVLYGLTEHDPEPVYHLVKDFGPIKLKLGALGVFKNPEQDVVYVTVESEDLHRLHAALAELPHVDSFPDYKPHATLAYVPSGKGELYASLLSDVLDGIGLEINEVAFIRPDKTRAVFATDSSNYCRDEESLFYASGGKRAPAGYTKANPLMIAGRPFIGGQWIPAEYLAQLSGEQKAQIEEKEKAVATRKEEKRAAWRGKPVDVGGFKQRVGEHKGEVADDRQMKKAKASFRILGRIHQDYILHRLEEIEDQTRRGLAYNKKLLAKATPEKALVLQERIRRHNATLGRIAHMLDWAEGQGYKHPGSQAAPSPGQPPGQPPAPAKPPDTPEGRAEMALTALDKSVAEDANEDSRRVKEGIIKNLRDAKISPENREKYAQAAKIVFDAMVPEFFALIGNNGRLSRVNYVDSLKDVKKLFRSVGGNPYVEPVGYYHSKNHDIVMDGAPPVLKGDDALFDIAATLVHELGHALDNNGVERYQYSKTATWHHIYEELKDKKLISGYGRSSPAEMFAEFMRAIMEHGVTAMSEEFKPIMDYLHSQGIAPKPPDINPDSAPATGKEEFQRGLAVKGKNITTATIKKMASKDMKIAATINRHGWLSVGGIAVLLPHAERQKLGNIKDWDSAPSPVAQALAIVKDRISNNEAAMAGTREVQDGKKKARQMFFTSKDGNMVVDADAIAMLQSRYKSGLTFHMVGGELAGKILAAKSGDNIVGMIDAKKVEQPFVRGAGTLNSGDLVTYTDRMGRTHKGTISKPHATGIGTSTSMSDIGGIMTVQNSETGKYEPVHRSKIKKEKPPEPEKPPEAAAPTGEAKPAGEQAKPGTAPANTQAETPPVPPAAATPAAEAASGKPKTYYHTTRETGTVKEGKSLGTWLTSSEAAANHFSGGKNPVKTMQASFKKPLTLSTTDAEFDMATTAEMNDALKKAGVKFQFDGDDDQEFWRYIDDGGEKLVNAIKKAGYDAVTLPEYVGNIRSDSTLVFDKSHVSEQAKPGGAAAPAGEAKPETANPASADHEVLGGIKEGELGKINGWPVRRTGPNEWRIDTDKGHVTGDADAVSKWVQDKGRGDKLGGKQAKGAIDRALQWKEPDFFTEQDRSEREAKAFESLPVGTDVVSLDENSRGRLGKIVRDEDGKTRVKLEGEHGYASNYVEPLDEKLSWRKHEEKKQGRTQQGSLFEQEERKKERHAKAAGERKITAEGKKEAIANWHKEARDAGLNVEHLDHRAKQIMDESKDKADEYNSVIDRAREAYKQYGDLAAQVREAKKRGGDYDSIPMFDGIAEEMAGGEFGSLFIGHDDPNQRLWDILQEGRQEPIDTDAAYRQAFTDVYEHRSSGRAADEAAEDGGSDVGEFDVSELEAKKEEGGKPASAEPAPEAASDDFSSPEKIFDFSSRAIEALRADKTRAQEFIAKIEAAKPKTKALKHALQQARERIGAFVRVDI